MAPDANESRNCESLMKVQEHLVESVADGRRSLDEDENHGNYCQEASLVKRVCGHSMANPCDTASTGLIDKPAADMCDGFEDDDSTDPPVEEVECVKGDAKKRNQGVVPCRK